MRSTIAMEGIHFVWFLLVLNVKLHIALGRFPFGDDVYVDAHINAGNSGTVVVTVSDTFKECMSRFDKWNNGAKIYCLRTNLWRYKEPEEEAEEEIIDAYKQTMQNHHYVWRRDAGSGHLKKVKDTKNTLNKYTLVDNGQHLQRREADKKTNHELLGNYEHVNTLNGDARRRRNDDGQDIDYDALGNGHVKNINDKAIQKRDAVGQDAEFDALDNGHVKNINDQTRQKRDAFKQNVDGELQGNEHVKNIVNESRKKRGSVGQQLDDKLGGHNKNVNILLRKKRDNAVHSATGDELLVNDIEENIVANSQDRKKRQSSEDNMFLKYSNPDDKTLPLSGPRVRKEYRLLTLDERVALHEALNNLSKSGVIRDFGEAHARAGMAVHDGSAFLAWHRAYLAYFEEALRKVNENVSLCYWDSSLENNLQASASMSQLFSPNFMGTGSGDVTEGPFAYWQVNGNAILQRAAGEEPIDLISETNIKDFEKQITNCKLEDFVREIESLHNNVHRWVGGHMVTLRSPYDPLFYMHHCFIDYLWEKFRQRQRTVCKPTVNSANDYPPDPPADEWWHNDGHLRNASMSQIIFLQNFDGIADWWTQSSWVTYQDRPTCDNNCGGSSYLKCNKGACEPYLRVDNSDSTTDIIQAAKTADENKLKLEEQSSQTWEADILSAVRKKREATDVVDNETRDQHNITKREYEDMCSEYPYFAFCESKKISDESIPDIVSDMCNGEIPMTKYAAKIQEMIDEEDKHAFMSLPLNEPVFFKASPKAMRGKKTTQTVVFDLLTAKMDDDEER